MKFLLLSILSISTAYAAGDGHHGSPADLIAPAINFFILTGFLIFKLKGPISNAFTEKSKKIKESMDRASVKAKEAQVKLEAQKNKLTNLDKEIDSIKLNATKEVENFNKLYTAEIERKTEKLKHDTAAKVEAEKKVMLNQLNTELVNSVISKTKNIIKTNNDLSTKVNNKITEGIQ